MRKTLLLWLAVSTLAGCATTIPTAWNNPSIKDPAEKSSRLSRDTSSCLNVSMGLAPMPQAYMPVPNDQPYNVSGQVTTYSNGDLSTGRFHGTVQPTPNFYSGFASGYNLGTAIMEAREQEEQKAAFVQCMNTLGWVDAKK